MESREGTGKVGETAGRILGWLKPVKPKPVKPSPKQKLVLPPTSGGEHVVNTHNTLDFIPIFPNLSKPDPSTFRLT